MPAIGCRHTFLVAWLAGLLLPGWMHRPRAPAASQTSRRRLAWTRSRLAPLHRAGVFCGLWRRWVAHGALVSRGDLDPPPWCSGRLWRTD